MTNSNEQARKAEADRAEAVELSDQELERAAGGINTLVARRLGRNEEKLHLCTIDIAVNSFCQGGGRVRGRTAP